MNFVCDDLSSHGVLLVPPSAQEYEMLLTDIESRANTPLDGTPPFPQGLRPQIMPEERPTSAILLNRSPKSIAGLQVVWRFETETGRTFRRSRGMLSPKSVLLPFRLKDESATRLYTYWPTIFSGSKRYIGESGLVGDNTDVRPPADDEKWRGGIIAGRGGGGGNSLDSIRQVTLVLDGVFFLDGEFAGPDENKMFERTAAEAEAHRTVAKIAKDAHHQGLSPAEILVEIEKITGLAPDHLPRPPHLRNPSVTQEDFRTAALQSIACWIAAQHKHPQAGNDEKIVSQ